MIPYWPFEPTTRLAPNIYKKGFTIDNIWCNSSLIHELKTRQFGSRIFASPAPLPGARLGHCANKQAIQLSWFPPNSRQDAVVSSSKAFTWILRQQGTYVSRGLKYCVCHSCESRPTQLWNILLHWLQSRARGFMMRLLIGTTSNLSSTMIFLSRKPKLITHSHPFHVIPLIT